jgi:hypothetical protein
MIDNAYSYMAATIETFELKQRKIAPVVYQLVGSFFLASFGLLNKLLTRIKSP